MGLKQDLPLILGMLIVLAGTVFAVGQAGLPGTGFFDNPLPSEDSDTSGRTDIKYDLTAQYTVGSYALGEVYVRELTYQTQKSCTLCMSIGDSKLLSLTGANAVRSEVTLTNTETGNTVLQTTKFLGEVSGLKDEQVSVNAGNLKPGTYKLSTRTVFEAQYFDITNDEVLTKSWTINVPKVKK